MWLTSFRGGARGEGRREEGREEGRKREREGPAFLVCIITIAKGKVGKTCY